MNDAQPPPHPALSLLDVAVGAGSLAARAGAPVLRAAGRVGGGVYARTRRAAAPALDPALDLAVWATQTLAEVGSLERARATAGVHALIEAVGTAVAADPGVQGMVRDLADSQLDPLLERALPIVLDRLGENPEAVRRIVQDQSAGIMTEATESARLTARHADDIVDSLTHRLFHRAGREQGNAAAARLSTSSASASAAAPTAVPTEPDLPAASPGQPAEPARPLGSSDWTLGLHLTPRDAPEVGSERADGYEQ
ncbi:MAG TPA: hypothetical protein VGX23_22555 [Actinocrinis sp.]|nr:hypothetical protein [Actinocrinis sp.]